jgi:preprotein translocase subunit SecB
MIAKVDRRKDPTMEHPLVFSEEMLYLLNISAHLIFEALNRLPHLLSITSSHLLFPFARSAFGMNEFGD